MEKLDKVIDALERCLDGDEACPGCYLNDYAGCRDKLNFDALAHLTVYRKQMQSIGDGGELIRRSDLLKFPIRRDHYDRENGNPHFINGIETVMEYAEYIPAVEAEPVVHAHWIPRHRRGNNWCECSACNTVGSPFWKRCPLCEAKMDETTEIRTAYCPFCDKHFEVRSNDSQGSCPDCGHHVVLHRVEVEDA